MCLLSQDGGIINYFLCPTFVVTFSYGTGFKKLMECVINEVRGEVCNKWSELVEWDDGVCNKWSKMMECVIN